MKPAFADTGFWIALLHPRDRWHQQAIALEQQFRQQQRKIVTSEMVLTEFLNFFSKFDTRIRQQAGRIVENIRNHSNTAIISQTPEQFAKALDLYLSRPDKSWSLTDCSSFLMMQELNLTEALAHDKHFQQAGFITLLGDKKA